jgi:murein DD-endopeptidase MepM/ murein hydrolase activator NlpD
MVTVPDLPVGGASPVASIQVSQARQDAVSATSANGYVQGLRSDIERLRQNHQDPELANLQSQDDRLSNDPSQAATDTYSAQSSEAFNQVLQASVENKPKKRQRPGTPFPENAKPSSDEAANSPDFLATGSSGTAAYQPLLQPTTGQMVSPQLPPLNGPEAYLPNSPAIFNGYIWPANGILTSGYGWRWGRMHNGIDIAGPVGTPIFAAASGVVTFAAWSDGGYGNLVEIAHPDGSFTLYAHNQRNLVREGQEVEQGEQVAEMGSTGFSTGPHLHFEIHPAGQGAVNPMAYLPRE